MRVNDFLKFVLLLAVLPIMVLGCKKPKNEAAEVVQVTVKAAVPTVFDSPTLVGLTGTFTNGDERVECSSEGEELKATLHVGTWQLEVVGEYREAWKSGTLRATYSDQVNITTSTEIIDAKLHYEQSNYRDGFIITEIFVTGTKKPDGKQYVDDKYIKIANASKDKTLYLDGYVLLCSHFLCTMSRQCTPEPPIAAKFPVDVIYQFPGGGKDYPVKPGEEIVICQSAIDHKEANPNSFDLGHALFEWQDYSSPVPQRVKMVGNPKVVDMKPIFVKQVLKTDQGQTWWLINMQESQTFAIGHFEGVTPESFVADQQNFFDYTYEIAGRTMGVDSPKPMLFPNEWVDDAVSLGVNGKKQWSVVSPFLDAGFISASTKENHHFFESVQRKKAHDGAWFDTNNSTNDFEAKRASLLPAQ